MAATYEPIASGTISGQNITFSNIPATFTDLVLVANLPTFSGNSEIALRMNGDTGNNYMLVWLSGPSGFNTLKTDTVTSNNRIYCNWSATAVATSQVSLYIHINSYTSSYNKTVFIRSGGSYESTTVGGQWMNTSVISSLTLNSSAVNYPTGSQAVLYGIKAGNA